MKYFLGVDVGTSSVRVGLFDINGNLIEQQTENIKVFNLKADFYEQSTEEIWTNICKCIRTILKNHSVGEQVVSIGFDATCSLVVLDANFQSISVNPNGNTELDVIMWMDHRAKKQAESINSTNYEGLKFVGGKISPEMDPPKILWLKQNLSEACYQKAEHFFSLPDFLVWKCTGQSIRSVCSLNCKWLYKSSKECKKWDAKFWSLIGLEDLVLENFRKIGSTVESPFKYIENLKISNESKDRMGLNPNVKVGVSMIDAHAGGIGGISLTYGYLQKNKRNLESSIEDISNILVLVSGTSSCFMATSKEPKFLNGIWGPYYEAMVPKMWLNEGGQSASGKLIDHIIINHPAFELLRQKADEEGLDSVFNALEIELTKMGEQKKLENISYLTNNIHVYPDFHGNRSPLADPNMLGQICGLSFDTSIENMALLYLACVQSLAYQCRHILETIDPTNDNFKIINIIGGLGQSNLYSQIISDVCDKPVILPKKSESVVIFGSAILGASNYEEFKEYSFEDLIKQFGILNNDAHNSILILPNKSVKKFHQAKYEVYLSMLNDQRRYRKIMENL